MTDTPAWPKGGGEMGDWIRRHDWAATPLGPIERWPAELRTMVGLLLSQGFPMVLLWGPELIQIHNDGYRDIMGSKHPAGLGVPTREVWPEMWAFNAPIYERVQGGETVTLADQLFPITRHGSLEDAWFTICYSPARDPDGAVCGVFITLFETTGRIAKEAEAALRESEQRFRQFSESSAEVLWISNAETLQLEYLSPAFEQVWGEPRDAMMADIGRWAELIHPDDLPKVGEGQKILLSGQRFSMEYRILRADGGIRYIRDTGFPILDEAGRIVRLGGIAQDLTDRRLAEEALRKNEERYRLIVENARDYAIIITDPDDIVTDWLPGAEAVFGWTAEEIIGRPAAITFTARDRQEGQPEKEIATAAREGFAPDVRWHERKDGRLVFIDGMVTPLRNEDGSIRAFLKIGQDVTERRNAEEALAASEARMRSLVTGIPQLVFRSYGTGERIWGSPQWIGYTDLSFEESLGFGWLEALHPDDRKATMEAWEEAEQRGEYYAEHRIRRAATGEYRWHQTRAIPSRDESGRVLEWLGTSNDVEELRRLHRHQQVLLAELQHRVRNTLGIIRSIARRTASTSASVEEMAMHLDGRLGAFSRVQTVLTRNPDAGVDLAGLIEDELLAHAAREGEALAIRGPKLGLKARAAESMSLAFHELTTNAVKYGALSSSRGRIDVSWGRSRVDGVESLNLVWEENGMNLPAGVPERQGFGLELLTRTLPYDLRATTEVEFRREGLRFSMALPLDPAMLTE